MVYTYCTISIATLTYTKTEIHKLCRCLDSQKKENIAALFKVSYTSHKIHLPNIGVIYQMFRLNNEMFMLYK